MLKISILSCALIIICSNAALSASFNCNRATTCTENVICETPKLSTLDSRMDRLYSDLQGNANYRGVRRLLNSQRAWLDNRDSCGCNANCLVGMYESRIETFNNVLGY